MVTLVLDSAERKKWAPRRGAQATRSLQSVREEMLDCLVHARGGTLQEQGVYLDEVLIRAGAGARVTWANLYRALTILRDDGLSAGADARLVQDHVTKLHRILEEVDD